MLRVKLQVNPDASRTFDWGAPYDPWGRTIAEQDGMLPVYICRGMNALEYMGQLRVTRVVTDASTLAERSQIVGETVSYAIHLERG